MTDTTHSSKSADDRITIAVDAMGGDLGPSAIVSGIEKSAEKNSDISFLVFGRKSEIQPLVDKRGLSARCDVRDMADVVTMDAKPSYVMRHGKGTSMWAAVDAVKAGEAQAVVSCGNTGALMAISMLRLRKLPGVARPAIACLWPSRNPGGFNIMLDVGADIRADENDLLQYALMGGSYARNGLGIERPRIGLLNVGTEEHKGRNEIKEAHDLITLAASDAELEFVGFVEGGDIPSNRVDVIVTDGFSGNIALKTGEGTAGLIREFLQDAFRATHLSKFAALLALNSLKRLSKRIDPRRVNGGVFLGLNGTVVKSHGAADATGVSSAIKLAYRLAESRFTERLAARVASASNARQDGEISAEKPAESEQAK